MPNPPVITVGPIQTIIVSGTDPNGNAAFAPDNLSLPAPAMPPINPDPPAPSKPPSDPIQPLLDSTIDGTLQVVLGLQATTRDHAKRLVFQEIGRGAAMPLPAGHLFVQYVTYKGLRSIVLFGDDHGDSSAMLVNITTPKTIGAFAELVPVTGWDRSLWMGDPESFTPGQYTVEWLDQDFNVLHTVTTPDLHYGDPYP